MLLREDFFMAIMSGMLAWVITAINLHRHRQRRQTLPTGLSSRGLARNS
jgi:hypothetical protein